MAALTRDGRVFRWGRREEVPATQENLHELFTPRPEELFFDEPVTDVAIAAPGVCVRLQGGDVVCVRHRERRVVEGLRGASSLFSARELLCASFPPRAIRCVRGNLAMVTITARGEFRTVVSGGSQLVAQRTDGSVWRGRIGNYNATIALTEEIPAARGATALWGSHSGWCFARDRRLWCLSEWDNVFFQGHGVHGPEAGTLPVLVVRDPSFVAVGNGAVCAFSRDETQPRCWGNAPFVAQRFGVGSGTTESGPMLPPGIPELVGVHGLVAHDGIACAYSPREPLRCWGHNNHGAILGGSVEWSLVALPREGFEPGPSSLSWHGRLACAVQGQALHCRVATPSRWLRGHLEVFPDHVLLPSLPAVPKAVTVGTQQVCAVLVDGRVACAPHEAFVPSAFPPEEGEERDETTSSLSSLQNTSPSSEGIPPTPPAFTVVPGLSEVTRLVDHRGLMCALSDRAPAHCWGNAPDWDIAPPRSNAPVRLPYLGPLRSLARGEGHGCAVDLEGTVWCWGRGRVGQLGSGVFSERARPARVPLEGPAEDVVVGSLHTCALASGAVWCWGYNGQGQLGDGSTTLRSVPTRVRGLDAVTHLTAHGDTTCARTEDGRVWCWGEGEHGQLGNGSSRPRNHPTPVRGA